MKKNLIYILLILHVFFTGNIGFVVNNYFTTVHALSSTWDFSTPGDYTLSSSTGSEIVGGIGTLNKTFFHIGSEVQSADLNSATDIVVDGNYAYVTSFTNDGIAVVDISDPTNPTTVATLLDNGTTILLNGASELVKSGDYLFVASQVSDAMQVIDVSNPLLPVPASQVTNTPSSNEMNGARGIVLNGDYVYVSAQTDRSIVTIDISTPTAPSVVDTDVEGTNLRGTRSLTISGDYLYATAYARDRITSMDITDPANPVLADSITDTRLDRAWFVEVSGNYAYVSTHNHNSVEVVDITDPTNMSIVASITNAGSFLLTQPRDLKVVGDVLFVTSNNDDAVTAIDISNPLAPVFLDSIVHAGGALQELNGARGVLAVGDRLYVASGVSDALEIVDYKYDTTSPTITANTAFDYGTEDLTTFTETLGAENAGTVTYQISRNNGTDWYYYNGSAWTLTTGGVAESSSASVINTNIDDFNSVGSGNEFLWKVFLTSDGNQKVEIDQIEVVSVAADPILSITKTDNDVDNIVNTSDVVRYTITLTNTGAAATGISITDTIDTDFGTPYNFMYTSCGSPSEGFVDPTLTFSSVSVDAGEDCVITYDVQVDAGATGGATITNSADPSAATEGGNNPAAANADTLTVRACGVNDITLNFTTDNWGEDTYWSLVPNGDTCGAGSEIANGGNPNLTCASGGAQGANAADGYADNTTINEGPYSLTVGNQYDLHVIDDWGDGMTGDPDVTITQNGAVTNTFALENPPGVSDIFTFTVQEPTGCADTTNPSLTIDQAPSQSDPTGSDSAIFKVVFDEAIDIATFIAADITLAGTTGSVTSGPTQVAPNNGTSFEFTVTGMTDGDTVTASMLAGVVADAAGNTNNASTSTDNQITYSSSDTTPPTVTSISVASGSLLPGANHTIFIEYSDDDSGINTSTNIMQLYKWDGISSYGSDLFGTNMFLTTLTSTGASYSTSDLDFGKYLYIFQIDDNEGNSSTSTGATFYIDIPEFIIGTGSIDIGTLSHLSPTFSDTVDITVKTVGAAFDVTMDRSSDFTSGLELIPSFSGSTGYGYQQTPYSGSISEIMTNQNIATQAASINTNGDKNTYIYQIQIGALIEEFQESGEYIGDLDFGISLTY